MIDLNVGMDAYMRGIRAPGVRERQARERYRNGLSCVPARGEIIGVAMISDDDAATDLVFWLERDGDRLRLLTVDRPYSVDGWDRVEHPDAIILDVSSSIVSERDMHQAGQAIAGMMYGTWHRTVDLIADTATRHKDFSSGY